MAKLKVPILVDWNDIKDHMAKSDIVEVVRCRDCKWRYEYTCLLRGAVWKEEEYCSSGERSEDG